MSLGIESRSPLGLGAAPPAYHRPISAARAPSPARGQQQQQQQQFSYASQGGAGGRTQQQQQQQQQQSPLSLSSTQQPPFKSLQSRQQQQPSGGLQRDNPYASAAMTAPSARQNLSRTQPLERGSPMGSPLSGVAGFGGPFHSPQPSPQHQQQSSPPWQHFRGPVAGVHRTSGGTNQNGNVTPVRTSRPQSSYPPSSGPAQRASPHQQSYNIITGGPVSPAPAANGRVPSAWEREDNATKMMRHPLVVDHAAGSRVYQGQTFDVDQMTTQASGRRGPASQRSQSVDRGAMQRHGHRHGHHGHGHHGQHHNGHNAHHDIFSQFDQPAAAAAAAATGPSRAQASPLHYTQGSPNGRAASPAPFNPASPHAFVDPQRFGGGGGGGGGAGGGGGIRFSPNALSNSASFAQFGSPNSGGGIGSPLHHTAPQFPSGGPLAQQQQQQQQQQPQSALRPPTGASDSSDDGAGFLEVGVAEDPNPRFRPTMEDAHVVRLGDDWVNQDAAVTARAGAGASPLRSPQGGGRGAGASGRRAASLDWGSPTSSSPTRRAGANAGGSTQFQQQQVQGGTRVKSGYFAIYDGHGGREAVDYIEKHLHRQLARQLREGAPPARALEAAFLDTDKAMQARGEYNESGSTVASALIRPSASRAGQRDLFVANVGDARAVVAVHAAEGGGAGPGARANGGGGSAPLKAVRLSRDHTPNDPAEADRVRRAGGSVFRGRVDGQLAVSRAIGDHALRRSGVSAVPHQQHMPLTRDHKFMIVACDGLWDVITDHEAVNLIAGMTDANKMADKLVKTAMARGTTDNVSAMVVRLQK